MNAEEGRGRRMRAPKLADIVAGKLRAWIVRHSLREGDQLPTLERLAASFGVSLQVVREAIRILETEDLLEIRRGHVGGVTVKAPTLEAVSRSVGVYLQYHEASTDDVVTARKVVESFAAGQLAAAPTPEILATLRDLIDRCEATISDSRLYATAVMTLHQNLVGLTGNTTLRVFHAAIVQTIQKNIGKVQVDPSLILDGRKKIAQSFRRLLTLIEERDVPGAEQHMRLHIENIATSAYRYRNRNEVIDLFAAPDEAPPLAESEPVSAPVATLKARRGTSAKSHPEAPKKRARRRS